MSRVIVLDTSLATGASSNEHPYATTCRNILMRVLRICHKYLVCNESGAEWRNHASDASKKWVVDMVRKDKQVHCTTQLFSTLVDECQGLLANDYHLIRKDAHLFDMALAHDKIIISGDDKVRRAVLRHWNLFEDLLYDVSFVTVAQDGSNKDEIIHWLEHHCISTQFKLSNMAQ